MKRFKSYKPGEQMKLNWKKNFLRAVCCDCAVVHDVVFTVAGDTLTLQAWRNNKMTRLVRAGKKKV